jgi:hypothetical protein
MSIDFTEPSATEASAAGKPTALAAQPTAPAAHEPLHALLAGSEERRVNGRQYLHQRADLLARGGSP